MDKKRGSAFNRRDALREGVGFFGRVVGEFVQGQREVTRKTVTEEPRNPLEPKRGLLRPPGAVEEKRFVELCSKCDECIKACPENTLFRVSASYGEAEGTPMFSPKRKPCYLCSELHCISVCDTGALVKPDKISDLSMGKARLDSSKCIAYEDGECRYCIDFCPLSGVAIIDLGGKPLIKALDCVGCGLCESNCRLKAGRTAIETLAPLSG